MKLSVTALLLGLSAMSVLAADNSSNPTNAQDRISYYLGVNFGSNIKKENLDVNVETVIQGLKDTLAGNPKMTEAEQRDTLSQLQTMMMAKRQEKAKAAKAEGDAWLAENAKKTGVKTTASGLQYKVIEEGSGESPKATDEVSVKYTGKLINGTEFDSTSRRGGNPARFRVNGVIRGWSEALQMMKKGAKYELYIPSQLAYGERGSGNSIPPNSALIFEVELVDIHPGVVPPSPAQSPVTSDIIKVPSAEEMKKGAKVEILKPEDVQREIEREKARKEQESKANAPK